MNFDLTSSYLHRIVIISIYLFIYVWVVIMSEHVTPLLSKCYQPIAPRLYATFFPVVCRRQQAFSFCLLSVMENGRFQSFLITFLPSHINRPHYLHCNCVFNNNNIYNNIIIILLRSAYFCILSAHEFNYSQRTRETATNIAIR